MAAVTIFGFLLWLKKSSWWSRVFRGDAAPCRSTARGVLGSLWQGRLGSGHYISLLLSIARMLMLALSSFTVFTLWWGSSSRIDAALIYGNASHGLVASSSTRTGISSRKAASPWVHAHPDIGHRYPFPVFPAGVVGRPVRKAVRTRCASEKDKTRSRLCFPTLSLPPRPPPLPHSLSLCYFLKYLLSLSLSLIFLSI
jgi:hypothetical protein